MLKKITLSLILVLPFLGLFAQGDHSNVVERAACISKEDRQELIQKLRAEVTRLGESANQRFHPKFIWPVRQSSNFNDPGVYLTVSQVDHNQNTNQLLDYNCGTRTYDTSNGYNHAGTDISAWPFGWHKMDNNQVQVIAAAAGRIIWKHDGEYDENCNWNNQKWNAVYLEHGDGSITWYGHLKSGSLTHKSKGSYVAKGEFLGIVGSSGISSGPHLHFEVYDKYDNLIDPFQGSCNDYNYDSWWENQKPYFDSGINKVMTNSKPPKFKDCNTRTVTNEKNQFSKGQRVYCTTFFRHSKPYLRSVWKLYDANNNLVFNKTYTHEKYFNWEWRSFYYDLPSSAIAGTWRWKITFNGQSYTKSFKVGDSNGWGKSNLTIYKKGVLTVTGTKVKIRNLKIKNTAIKKSQSCYVGYFLSKNKTITTYDTKIGSVYIPSLFSGQISTQSFDKDIANLDLPQGNYYVGVIVDYNNSVNESNENDNTAYWVSPTVNTTCICSFDINPVCGSDGITYGNPCLAQCAGIYNYSYGDCGSGSSCECTNSYSNSICEDFESYNLGKLGPQSSCWTTWSGYEGGNEDGIIMGNSAYHYIGIEGTRSSGGTQDVVFQLGNRTSGKYVLEYNMFIYYGEKAYYNILHTFNPGAGADQWAQDVFFDGTGSGRLKVGGGTTYFNYPTSTWFNIRQEFDINGNLSKLFINGKYVKQWKFRYQSATTSYGTNRLAAIDFYPMSTSYRFFIDDFTFYKVNSFDDDILEVARMTFKPEPGKKMNSLFENENELEYDIYPNPVNTSLNIDLKLIESQYINFSLINSMGEIVLSEQWQGSLIHKSVDMGNIPSGIYFARVIIGEESRVKKISIVH